jgi:hypothetical protein
LLAGKPVPAASDWSGFSPFLNEFSSSFFFSLFPVLAIDYRYDEDGSFYSETGVIPGIRSRKSTYLNEHDVRKPLVVSISQRSEELRLYTVV